MVFLFSKNSLFSNTHRITALLSKVIRSIFLLYHTYKGFTSFVFLIYTIEICSRYIIMAIINISLLHIIFLFFMTYTIFS